MLRLLIIGFVVLALVLVLGRSYVRADVKSLKTVLKWLGLALVVGIGAWLVLSGKLIAALLALPAVLFWLYRMMVGLRLMRMASQGFGGASPGQTPSDNAEMTRDQAYRVLGLEPGASTDEINAAYKRLMAKVHPDLGGSDDLAQRLNRARDVLLHGP